MPFSLVTLGSQLCVGGVPKVTFWKTQHRKPSEFLLLCVEQEFSTRVSFGESSTCPVGACGDLVREVVLKLETPAVFSAEDPSRCFRWKPGLGYRAIRSVQVEVNGELLQTLTGDWLLQQMQLSDNLEGLKKMVGEVPSMTQFSPLLQPRTLFVPLPLWFCARGRYFPVRVTDNFKVRLDLEPLGSLLEQGPLFSCRVVGGSSAPWVAGDELATDGGGTRVAFFGFDGDRLLFNLLQGCLPAPGDLLRAGASSVAVSAPAQALPDPGPPQGAEVRKASLLVDYVLLGDRESELVLAKDEFHYLLPEVHVFQSPFSRDAAQEVRFSVPAPCVEVVWCVEDRLGNKVSEDVAFTLQLNGSNFLEDMPTDFFRYIQPFQHHNHYRRMDPGYFFYSFALAPEQAQPSGSCAPLQQMQLLMKKKGLKVDLRVKVFVTTLNVVTVREGRARLIL